MELVRFFLPFGIVLVGWIFISQVLAQLVSYNRSTEGILSMWLCIFLAPILIMYTLISWAQMRVSLALYGNIRTMTLGMVDMKKPSEDVRDYIP